MLCWDSGELFDINFCNISFALGERVESTRLLFLFLFIICDITLFPASVTPNATRSPTAPRRGVSDLYFVKYMNQHFLMYLIRNLQIPYLEHIFFLKNTQF